MARLFFLAALLAVGYAKPKEDERACEGARARLERRPTATVLPPHNHLFAPAVCKAVIDEIDKLLTVKDREDVESVEKVMQKYDTDQDGTFSMPEVRASRPPVAYG